VKIETSQIEMTSSHQKHVSKEYYKNYSFQFSDIRTDLIHEYNNRTNNRNTLSPVTITYGQMCFLNYIFRLMLQESSTFNQSLFLDNITTWKKPDHLYLLNRPIVLNRKVNLTENSMFIRKESERTDYSSRGNLVTETGQVIDFQLKMNMERRLCSSEIQSATYQYSDPLLINYGADAVTLTDYLFAFDLDQDGKTELISTPAKGSGFLCFDANKDGFVNNGSELFGTESGNGFYDLKSHDDDGNNWIDENDLIYHQLSVGAPDNGTFSTGIDLQEAGIGAIYLGHVETPYDLLDESGKKRGVIRNTGIYLNEHGTPGTVQQMDYAFEDNSSGSLV